VINVIGEGGAMKRSLIALTAVVPLALVGPAAAADPQSTPNGPWPGENAPNIAGLRSYEQLWSTLESIENRAAGAFELSAAPLQSNTGRDIPVVTIGDGPTSIMIIAQQHGDEYVVSEAMIEMIRDLSGNSAADKAIREALSVTIVPRVNVDGFDADVTDAFGRTPPWRQNYDPSCTASPCDPFYQLGRGYDINRYHSYSANAYDHPYRPGDDNDNPVPESIAMRLLYDLHQPEVVIDFHHQGSYVDADGRLITGSTMWPNAVDTAVELGIEDEFAEAITLSKQVVATMVTALEPYGYANITRYPGTETPGIARNAYGLLGAGSVLFEMRGGMYTQSNGYITKTAYEAGMAVVEAAADGSLWTTSTDAADALPDRGPGIGDPHDEGPEE
jgi:predicted deacylase